MLSNQRSKWSWYILSFNIKIYIWYTNLTLIFHISFNVDEIRRRKKWLLLNFRVITFCKIILEDMFVMNNSMGELIDSFWLRKKAWYPFRNNFRSQYFVDVWPLGWINIKHAFYQRFQVIWIMIWYLTISPFHNLEC